MKRRVRGFSDIPTDHRALLPSGRPFSQPWETIPEPNRHRRRCDSNSDACPSPQNTTGGDYDIEAEGDCEGEKSEISDGRHQAVEMGVVFALHDDAVIGTWYNQ
jgi:hypothetical protein